MVSLTAMISKEINLEAILSFNPGFAEAISSDWIHWRIVMGFVFQECKIFVNYLLHPVSASHLAFSAISKPNPSDKNYHC